MHDTPNHRPSPSDAAASGRTEAIRGAFARITIMLAALLFVGTIGVIYYRWITTPQPSSELVVYVNEALAGATISVEGVVLPRPYRTTVRPEQRLTIPIFLEAGAYTIRVTMDLDDETAVTLFEEDFLIARNRRHRLNLTELDLTERLQAD